MKKVLAFCVVLIVSAGACAGVTADFDNLSLAPDSHWNGEQNWIDDGSPVPGQGGVPAEPNPIVYDDTFASGSMSFNNSFSSGWSDDYGGYSWTSWEGFAYSNETDTTTPGFGNQFSAITGSAHSGGNFAVGYPGWSTPSTVTLDAPAALGAVQLTNTTYAYLSMRDGDFFTDPLAPGDWFKVTITGKDASGAETGSIDVYLADYRDGKTILVDTWQEADLGPLDVVKTVEFTVSASDGGAGWPSYFAMDSMVPEPATMTLLAFGGTALLWRRRRK